MAECEQKKCKIIKICVIKSFEFALYKWLKLTNNVKYIKYINLRICVIQMAECDTQWKRCKI